MCNSNNATAAKKIHPFEARNLGLAPFTCVGHYEDRGPHYLPCGSMVGAPGQPMGTCQYCGNGIANCFRIRSADGKEFIVGSDCVAKTNKDAATTAEQRALVLSVNKVVKDRQRAARKAAELRKLDTAREWFDANRATLEATPSRVREGSTLWDQVEWYRRNAGTKGILGLFKDLKAVLGE